MTPLDLRSIARALGGDVTAGQVIAPGPGHSRGDRSMSIRVDPRAPDGFTVNSFAGDNWRDCRDYVKDRLGIVREREPVGRWRSPPPRPAPALRAAPEPDDAARRSAALSLWDRASDPRGTLAERYLKEHRKLELPDDIAGSVLRFDAGKGAMVALFRDIHTGEPQGISRTFLDRDGRKLYRKFLGIVGGGAIMLDPFDAVTAGIHIGEGIETCLTARQRGLRPTWALGSAGAIAGFPVLSGIECLTLFAENDEAARRAVETCAVRWHEAGREVIVNTPRHFKDLNDAIRSAS